MDTEYIKEVLEADIARLGCKVWGLEFFGRRSNQTLRIYIDKNEGITVEDCEKVSKHVSKVLDAENDFSEKYMLEVSSCLLYTSPSPRDQRGSRMPSSA